MRDLDFEPLFLEPGSKDIHALLRLVAFPAAPDEEGFFLSRLTDRQSCRDSESGAQANLDKEIEHGSGFCFLYAEFHDLTLLKFAALSARQHLLDSRFLLASRYGDIRLAGKLGNELPDTELKCAEPDIPVADGIPVVLERKGQLIGMSLVGRAGLVGGRAGQLNVVVHQDAVVEYGHPGRLN